MERPAPDEGPGGGSSRAFVALLLVFAAGVLANFLPPRGPLGEADDEFSVERAGAHLALVAAEPRPRGSERNTSVRDYLVTTTRELGYEPEVQTVDVSGSGSLVHNVVVPIAGTGGGPTVLFMCHYDSRVETPGAGDDGAAVAALLEVLRALALRPRLERDLLFLFTDAEEEGLLGAAAFRASHREAGEIGFVVNFDAIGNAGPPVLFETGRLNAWAVEQLARACSSPVGTSFGKAIYDRMANDTDFTVFRGGRLGMDVGDSELGHSGLNFALCCGSTAYHQPGDTVGRLSRASLEHIGATALELALHLGASDLEDPRRGDAVFFSVLGLVFVHFSSAWCFPAAVLLLFAAVLAAAGAGRSAGWRPVELALAAGRLVLVVVGGALLAGLAVTLLTALGGGLARACGFSAPSGGNAFSGTLSFLVLGSSTFVLLGCGFPSEGPEGPGGHGGHGGHGRRRQASALALLLGASTALWVSRHVPGASYVLLLPALGGLLALLGSPRPEVPGPHRPPGLQGLLAKLARTAHRGLLPGRLALLPLLLLCAPNLHLLYMVASRAPLKADVGLALALACLAALSGPGVPRAVGALSPQKRAGWLILLAGTALVAGIAREGGY